MTIFKQITFLFLPILIVGLFFTSNNTLAAGRVFYDGFEDGTMNAWAPGESSGYYAKCDSVTSSLDGLAGPHGGKWGQGQYFCKVNG